LRRTRDGEQTTHTSLACSPPWRRAGTAFLPPQVSRLGIDGLRIGEGRRALEVRLEKAGARAHPVTG